MKATDLTRALSGHTGMSKPPSRVELNEAEPTPGYQTRNQLVDPLAISRVELAADTLNDDYQEELVSLTMIKLVARGVAKLTVMGSEALL